MNPEDFKRMFKERQDGFNSGSFSYNFNGTRSGRMKDWNTESQEPKKEKTGYQKLKAKVSNYFDAQREQNDANYENRDVHGRDCGMLELGADGVYRSAKDEGKYRQ